MDVDDTAARFYRGLSGPLGDRLRAVLRTDEDGTIMINEDDRCPMWRQDGLCRIQAELGHDALCKTCREFPRLLHEFGSFTELDLELSCPEAARLIFSAEYQDICHTLSPDPEEPVEDADILPAAHRVTQLAIYRWNRHYPSDRRFPIEVFRDRWQLISRREFPGKSHETITLEVYAL